MRSVCVLSLCALQACTVCVRMCTAYVCVCAQCVSVCVQSVPMYAVCVHVHSLCPCVHSLCPCVCVVCGSVQCVCHVCVHTRVYVYVCAHSQCLGVCMVCVYMCVHTALSGCACVCAHAALSRCVHGVCVYVCVHTALSGCVHALVGVRFLPCTLNAPLCASLVCPCVCWAPLPLFSMLVAASCVPELHLDPQGIWFRAEGEEKKQRKCLIVINLPYCKIVVTPAAVNVIHGDRASPCPPLPMWDGGSQASTPPAYLSQVESSPSRQDPSDQTDA
uniref:Uncharacterized protein n=1 Tax=Zonotrichia albicollis TaxID=44394 RepID=A0A8D2Q9X1_ZONAL